ncbi:MAG: class GN sortase [Rhodovibrionaceae bacterium]|nr:class GN sortase [Rhodovibrionaceae bacterium]
MCAAPGLLALGLLALASVFLGKGLYIDAKALVAQVLLKQAWADTLETGEPARPWPWADTQAIGRLRVPGGDIDQIVLAGASGRNLAFGPVRLEIGPAAGLTILSGHRDTHFAFLRRLQPGGVVELQGTGGEWRRYRVSATEVIDAASATMAAGPDEAPAGLVLVTCWPFDAVDPGTPWRFVVSAIPVAEPRDG